MRRKPDLVDAKRPFHRIVVDPRNQVLAANDEANLRAAQQLIAGKCHEVRTV